MRPNASPRTPLPGLVGVCQAEKAPRERMATPSVGGLAARDGTQKRLVYLDAFRSLSVTIVVALHVLEICHACRNECNWTTPLFYFEYMSGLFFSISGVVNSLSVCGQLRRTGRSLPAIRSQLVRGLFLAAIGVSMHAVENVARELFEAPDDVELRRLLQLRRLREDFTRQLYVAMSDPRALVFHGVCSFLASCLLIAVQVLLPATHGTRQLALLGLGALVLAAHPPLRRAVDRATCCTVKTCDSTSTAPAGKGALFRVPARCTFVLGNGTVAAQSPFDPCDFDAPAGIGLYLPRCPTRPLLTAAAAILNVTALEEGPTAEALCERAERQPRAACFEAGPWRVGGSEVSCRQLATRGECAVAKVADTTPFIDQPDAFAIARAGAGGHDGPVAELCPRACQPWLCLDSTERVAQAEQLRRAVNDPSVVSSAEAAKPEAEAERLAESRRNAARARAKAVHRRRERLGRLGLRRAELGAPKLDFVPTAEAAAQAAGVVAGEASGLTDIEASLLTDPLEVETATRESTCREALINQYTDEARRSHGMPYAAFGREWCPSIAISEVTRLAEVVSRTCTRAPWWAERAMTAPELSWGGRAAALGLQLGFGLHGAFSYLAASLAGAAVGMHLHQSGPNRALYVVGGLGCALSFAIGLTWTYELRKVVEEENVYAAQPATDAFMRASSHTRVLWGASEMAIILVGIAFVDAVPARRVAWERSTRRFARLGQCSLTVFAFNDLFGRLVYLPFRRYAVAANLSLKGADHNSLDSSFLFEIGVTRTSPAERTRQSIAEDAWVLLYILATLFGWASLLALWSRVGFVCSFEWWIGKLIGVGKATRPAGKADAAGGAGGVGGAGGAGEAGEADDRRPGAAESATLSEEATDLADLPDGAVVWIWLLTMTWAPAAGWAVLSSTWLAPSLNDYYYQLNATHLLLTPLGTGADGKMHVSASEDGWRWLVHKAAPPMKLSLGAQLFVLSYVLPVLGCQLRLVVLGMQRRRAQLEAAAAIISGKLETAAAEGVLSTNLKSTAKSNAAAPSPAKSRTAASPTRKARPKLD